jgi:hypothetical protein
VSVEESVGERQVSAAKSQSLFREVNERVESLNESFSTMLPLGDFICECANNICVERIALSFPEYESVRDDPRRFCVAAGDLHVWPDVENVVERNERFWIVEKIEEAGRVAEGLDPRKRRLRVQA